MFLVTEMAWGNLHHAAWDFLKPKAIGEGVMFMGFESDGLGYKHSSITH